MNKISISAALLALAMLGCSESGMENSMAPVTSASQDGIVQMTDETPIILKKATVSCPDGIGQYECPSKFVDAAKGYTYTANGIALTSGNTGGEGRVYIRVKDRQGRFVNNSHVDFLHTYGIAVCDCRMNGVDFNCQNHSFLAPGFLSNIDFTPNNQNGIGIIDRSVLSNQCAADRLGYLFIYAAVFNAGRSDEVVLQGASYAGNLNANTAVRVYQKYILPAQLREAGL